MYLVKKGVLKSSVSSLIQRLGKEQFKNSSLFSLLVLTYFLPKAIYFIQSIKNSASRKVRSVTKTNHHHLKQDCLYSGRDVTLSPVSFTSLRHNTLYFIPSPSCTRSQLASAKNLSIFSIEIQRSLVIMMRLTQFVMLAFFARDISAKPRIFRTFVILVALIRRERITRPAVWIMKIWNGKGENVW